MDTQSMVTVRDSTPSEARLLIVDDEPNIVELLAASLRYAGFEVETAPGGEQAVQIARRSAPDLIVLDVMLPGLDGFGVVRRLRGEGVRSPVLFLTARDATEDKISGLTLGGDDYVTKPFSLEEVIARIRAILRRVGGPGGPAPARHRFADLELDDDAHEYYVVSSDASGNNLVRLSDPLRAGLSQPNLPKFTVFQAAARQGKPFTVGSLTGSGQWRVLVAPLAGDSGSLAVATSLNEVNSTVGRLQLLELVTGLIVLVLLGGLAYLLVRTSLRPLREVEETAAAIAGGDLSRRVPEHHPGTEVGRLSTSLNGMLAQVEAAFDVTTGLRAGGAGIGGPDAALRHRRQPRTTDSAHVDQRLRRALPPGRGGKRRGRGAVHAPDRGHRGPDGPLG